MPPIYDYICKKCQHEFEIFSTSFSQAEVLEKEEGCPKCGEKEKERKVPTSTSFQLKGRGWAKDRYSGN